MTLSGTNCYLLSHGAGPDITLVDTGSPSPSAPAFIRLLSEHLRTTGGIIRDIVLTHHHIDHVGGLESVLASIRSSGAPQPKVHKFKTPDPGSLRPSRSVVSDEDLEASVRAHSRNDVVINWMEAGDLIGAIESPGLKRLRVLHTPGHTSDSISLLLEETGELFVGDTILG
jgi:ribonuclease/clavin/mitogillin